ncbi:hypothetical protein NHQ30_007005 [Ciborinia camelliae]|nr:hypothetical protein NHQ30_007005 [Ciborinia camelliae]
MAQYLNPEIPEQVAVKSETRLTFGVEIEYLLGTFDPNLPDPYPEDPRERNAKLLGKEESANIEICKKIQAAGFPASVKTDYGMLTINPDSEPRLAKDASHVSRTDWILTGDGSVITEVDPPIHENCKEIGLEIVSPPYYYDKASRDAVRTVIETLRNNYLVRVNENTGLHVHVGNEHDGFLLSILRNLVAIIHTYERQIRLILSDDRVSRWGSGALWCRPLYYGRFGSLNPVTRSEFLMKILSYQDYNHLIEDMGRTDELRLGFNLINLKLPWKKDKRTVEFRYHQGSLDPDEILNWIDVCVKIVEKACFIKNQEELEAQLKRDVEKSIGLGKEDASLVDFLMWLGCPVQAYYYGVRLIANRPKLEERIKLIYEEDEHYIEETKRMIKQKQMLHALSMKQTLNTDDEEEPSSEDRSFEELSSEELPSSSDEQDSGAPGNDEDAEEERSSEELPSSSDEQDSGASGNDEDQDAEGHGPS